MINQNLEVAGINEEILRTTFLNPIKKLTPSSLWTKKSMLKPKVTRISIYPNMEQFLRDSPKEMFNQTYTPTSFSLDYYCFL